MTEELEKSDMELLLQRPEFLRFLLRVIQTAGIFTRTTDGSGTRNLDYDEGRRNLGLQILEMAEAAQPQVSSIIGIPVTTLTQAFLEEARRPQPEKPNAKYDRTAELNEPDDDQAD